MEGSALSKKGHSFTCRGRMTAGESRGKEHWCRSGFSTHHRAEWAGASCSLTCKAVIYPEESIHLGKLSSANTSYESLIKI